MTYSYKPKGVCSRSIDIVIEDNIIQDVVFAGGCSGNLQGVSRLVQGMRVEDAIAKLQGIDCGGKGTSCPDQLTKALAQAVANR